MFKSDYEMIVHKLSTELLGIRVYPLGDLHIGSPQFDMKRFQRWVDMVAADPDGYAVFVGDLLDNGTKFSKTNSYEQTMRPMDQKWMLAKMLKPISHKILGAVQGNHEARTTKESDGCPMYDVMAKLDLEDRYRENMAFLKVNLGFKSKERQYSYAIALGHGASKAKTEKFSYALDGVDVFITGHTHDPSTTFPMKLVFDSHNEVIREVDFTHVVVPSPLVFGGYALKAMYLPKTGSKIPIIHLSGIEKAVDITWKSLGV